jgi:hypothetical protein
MLHLMGPLNNPVYYPIFGSYILLSTEGMGHKDCTKSLSHVLDF